MSNWFIGFVKFIVIMYALLGIYLILDRVISHAKSQVQAERDSEARATVSSSYVSLDPFGESTNTVKSGSQIFYNIEIEEHNRPDKDCFVKTSWYWSLHLPSDYSVVWSSPENDYYLNNHSKQIAQAIVVPETLPKGQYTLRRLATFKCNNIESFAKTVREIDLKVE